MVPVEVMFPVETLATFAAPALEMEKLGLKILPTVRPPEHVTPENVPVPDVVTFVPVIAPVVSVEEVIPPEHVTPEKVPRPPDETVNDVLLMDATSATPHVIPENVPTPERIL